MLSYQELLLRILVGTLLGGTIGYERDKHRRPVGFRTHLLVAMAAATFMVVSTQFVYYQRYAAQDLVEVDTSRIAASVVTGMGFLGGGAILRSGLILRGVTTAAGLWLVTAIGMCSGAGMFVVASSVTAMGLFALTIIRRLEDKRLVDRQIVLTVASKGASEHLVERLKSLGVTVADTEYEWHAGEGSDKITVTLDARIPDSVSTLQLVEAMETVEGVRRVQIKQS